MADVVSQKKRHEMMSSIKSKNTKPEMFFRKGLFNRGYRYSLYPSKIDGHPDLFLKKYNTAIFIHGCFWHRHYGCKYAYIPKSNVAFWEKKFNTNMERDLTVKKLLYDRGIKCLVIWECQVKKMMKSDIYKAQIYDSVIDFLTSEEKYMEI